MSSHFALQCLPRAGRGLIKNMVYKVDTWDELVVRSIYSSWDSL